MRVPEIRRRTGKIILNYRIASAFRSFLYSADCDTGDEILLEPRVDAQDGDSGEHYDSGLQRSRKTGAREALLGCNFYRIDIVDDIVEEKLQRIILCVLLHRRGQVLP